MEELKRLFSTLRFRNPPLTSLLHASRCFVVRYTFLGFVSHTHTHTTSGEGDTAAGLHTPHPDSEMAKQDCPAGKKWDSLISICVLKSTTRTEPGPPTERPLAKVVQLRSTAPAAQAHSVMLLTPALWVFVGLATMGSILALALWLVIYKRQTSTSAVSVAEEAGLQQHPLQKTEQPAKSQPSSPERNGQAEIMQRAAWAPSPCAHLHLGDQTGHKWAEGFTACSDPAKHDGMDEIPGMRACSTTREHRIPLPAIELGGTVLVTTKTV
ncbi:uncharacterized protein LOC120828301 isoform X1 [Gasterosteus aculeatus]